MLMTAGVCRHETY